MLCHCSSGRRRRRRRRVTVVWCIQEFKYEWIDISPHSIIIIILIIIHSKWRRHVSSGIRRHQSKGRFGRRTTSRRMMCRWSI